jgi:hypothetical protein
MAVVVRQNCKASKKKNMVILVIYIHSKAVSSSHSLIEKQEIDGKCWLILASVPDQSISEEKLVPTSWQTCPDVPKNTMDEIPDIQKMTSKCGWDDDHTMIYVVRRDI